MIGTLLETLRALPAIIAALEVVDLVRDEDWLAGVLFHADGYVNEAEARNAARAIIAALGEEVK